MKLLTFFIKHTKGYMRRFCTRLLANQFRFKKYVQEITYVKPSIRVFFVLFLYTSVWFLAASSLVRNFFKKKKKKKNLT